MQYDRLLARYCRLSVCPSVCNAVHYGYIIHAIYSKNARTSEYEVPVYEHNFANFNPTHNIAKANRKFLATYTIVQPSTSYIYRFNPLKPSFPTQKKILLSMRLASTIFVVFDTSGVHSVKSLLQHWCMPL